MEPSRMKTIPVIALLLPLLVTQAREPFQLREGDVRYLVHSGHPGALFSVPFGFGFRGDSIVVLDRDDSVWTMADTTRIRDTIVARWDDLKRRVAIPDSLHVPDAGGWSLYTSRDTLQFGRNLEHLRRDSILFEAVRLVEERISSMNIGFRATVGDRIADSLLVKRYRETLERTTRAIEPRRRDGKEIDEHHLRRLRMDREIFEAKLESVRKKYGTDMEAHRVDSVAGKP